MADAKRDQPTTSDVVVSRQLIFGAGGRLYEVPLLVLATAIAGSIFNMGLKHISAAHRSFDEVLLAFRQRRAQEGRPVVVSCHRGCFSCCKEPAYAFEEEALHIVDGLSPDQLERVKARVRVWLDAFKASGLMDVEMPNAFAYRVHNLWCPLLEGGQCMAYKRRPLGCRGHMAHGPAKDCDDDERRKQQTFLSVPELTDMAVQVILDGSEEVEGDHLGVLLARILLGEDHHRSGDHVSVKLPGWAQA